MTTSRTPSIVVDATKPAHHTLVPPERDVLTGRSVDLDREDKGRRHDDHDTGVRAAEHPPSGLPGAARRPRLPRWAVVVAGAAVVLVVAGGVAVASGVLGGGEPAASGQTADAAPGSGGDGGGGGGDVPPALDPARVTGYAMTVTRTAVEAGPGIELGPADVVGATRQSEWTCEEGVCTSGGWVLQVGAPSVSLTHDAPTMLEGPCFPVTIRLDLALAEDGTYRGTLVRDPVEVFAEYATETGSGSCSSARLTDEVVLVPILAED